MFASQVPEYLADPLLGTSSTANAVSNFKPVPPAVPNDWPAGRRNKANPALRDGAQQSRLSGRTPESTRSPDRPRPPARIRGSADNSTSQNRRHPNVAARRDFQKLYGDGPNRARSAADRTLTLTVPALSTVSTHSTARSPNPMRAQHFARRPNPGPRVRGRMHVSASVDGSSFYE